MTSMMNTNVFKHSGDLGDIIYGMAVMKTLGGGHLRLTPGRGVRERMTQRKAASIGALASRQPYIHSVRFRVEIGGKVTHDFDSFRESMSGNLIDAQFKLFGLKPNHEPWLWAEPQPKSEVIFTRSARYHNPRFDWKEAHRLWGSRAVFVGTVAEHKQFCKDVAYVYHLLTPTLLDLAQVIAGCKLMVANQSCPLAIGYGLGATMIIEECPYARDCHLDRTNCWFSVSSELESAGINR